MKILMVTNTYAPHVGGVARSVQAFAEEYRQRGHRVLVVAPEFENRPKDETDVVRVSAIQNFNGSDFSVALPIPRFLMSDIEEFGPDVVHSHHPFLLGATALRVAHYYDRPLVFTHHTMYERYTHYVPGDSPALKRFAIDLATHYANMCDFVLAPSESTADVLRSRGVHAPLEVIPTGVDVARFAHGDGAAFRAARGLPAEAYVLGHVGRLAAEKGLPFLCRAVAGFLGDHPDARFLLVGRGPLEDELREHFASAGLAARLHMAHELEGSALVDAYAAMDVFAFASKSETQGMVLTEAMAAGVPVIAVDASGVRDVVEDRQNGRLLDEDASEEDFRRGLEWHYGCAPEARRGLVSAARETARVFSIGRCAERSLALYERLRPDERAGTGETYRLWEATQRMIATEWDLVRGMTEATRAAFQSQRSDDRP